MNFHDLMRSFAEEIGFSGSDLDSDGGIRIVAEEDMYVDIGPSPDGKLICFSSVVSLPDYVESPDLARKILTANLIINEKSGAALALDPQDGDILLLRSVALEFATTEMMDDELGRFFASLNLIAKTSLDELSGEDDGHSKPPATALVG